MKRKSILNYKQIFLKKQIKLSCIFVIYHIWDIKKGKSPEYRKKVTSGVLNAGKKILFPLSSYKQFIRFLIRSVFNLRLFPKFYQSTQIFFHIYSWILYIPAPCHTPPACNIPYLFHIVCRR